MSPTCTEISVRNADSPRSISSQISASHTKSRPAPPYSVGNRRAQQAQLGHALDDAHVEVVVDVVLLCDRQNPAVDELAHRLLDRALLVGQIEVHSSGSSGPRRGRERRPLILNEHREP